MAVEIALQSEHEHLECATVNGIGLNLSCSNFQSHRKIRETRIKLLLGKLKAITALVEIEKPLVQLRRKLARDLVRIIGVHPSSARVKLSKLGSNILLCLKWRNYLLRFHVSEKLTWHGYSERFCGTLKFEAPKTIRP